MIQDMHLQYDEAPQPTYEPYGVRGHYKVKNGYRGSGGRGSQRRGNWQGGRGVCAPNYLTHYCCTHGICAHPGTYCRTPAEGHKKNVF